MPNYTKPCGSSHPHLHPNADIRIVSIRIPVPKSASKSAQLLLNPHSNPQSNAEISIHIHKIIKIYRQSTIFSLVTKKLFKLTSCKYCTTLQNPQPNPQNYAEIRSQIRTNVLESASANFSVLKSASAFRSESANFRIIYVREFWKWFRTCLPWDRN